MKDEDLEKFTLGMQVLIAKELLLDAAKVKVDVFNDMRWSSPGSDYIVRIVFRMWGKQSKPVTYYDRRCVFNLFGIRFYKYDKIKIVAKATALTDGSYKTFIEVLPLYLKEKLK